MKIGFRLSATRCHISTGRVTGESSSAALMRNAPETGRERLEMREAQWAQNGIGVAGLMSARAGGAAQPRLAAPSKRPGINESPRNVGPMLARQALIVTSARQMPDGAVKPAVRSGVLRQVLHSGVPRPCLAVVLRAFEGGGAQRDIILLCNALAAKGVNVTVLALHQDGPLRSLLD